MKRSPIAAAALFAGIAIAAPMLAWSADEQPHAGQSAPAGRAMPGMGDGMMGGMGMMGHMHRPDRMGMMDRHSGMRDMMMHRMMHMSPQQRCEERAARRAARVAYTVTKLKLTTEQQPLWDKLNATLQSGREKQLQLCGSLDGGRQAQPTVLDRLDRTERFLSARLQAVQQVRPALEQLYQALTPEQKAVIDHSGMRG